MLNLRDFELERTFWEVNPELAEVVDVYRNFYSTDPSEKKTDSSKVMYAIAFIYDYESKFKNIAFDDRVELIETEFLKDRGFFKKNLNFLQPLISIYNKLQEDAEIRFLRTWEHKVNERTKFLETVEYNAKNWEQIDNMLLSSAKILAQKDEILDRLNKTEKETIKGGQKLSLLAQGKLSITKK